MLSFQFKFYFYTNSIRLTLYLLLSISVMGQPANPFSTNRPSTGSTALNHALINNFANALAQNFAISQNQQSNSANNVGQQHGL